MISHDGLRNMYNTYIRYERHYSIGICEHIIEECVQNIVTYFPRKLNDMPICKNNFFLQIKQQITTTKNYVRTSSSSSSGSSTYVITIIAYKDKIKLNYTGNPAMTVGGTGDVLAGLCAGFYAQSSLSNLSNEERLFNSACAAAFVNGLAGDKVEKVVGNGLIASDLLKEIGKIIKKLEVSCM